MMFYSTPVLRPLLPNTAGLIGIGIAIINALMTLPAVFMVDVSYEYDLHAKVRAELINIGNWEEKLVAFLRDWYEHYVGFIGSWVKFPTTQFERICNYWVYRELV